MQRLNPTTIMLIAGAALLLLFGFLFLRGGNEDQDKLTSIDNATSVAADDPDKRCASKATYDLIERELFRRAGQVRGSDQAAFARLADYASLRMERPVLESEDEDRGQVSCSGALSLDLPPGVAVVGGRRTLSADVDYQLQRSADGSGDVLTLSNADAIITPLATLARAGQPNEQPGMVAEPGYDASGQPLPAPEPGTAPAAGRPPVYEPNPPPPPRPAPAPRPAPVQQRPAPVQRPEPIQRPAPETREERPVTSARPSFNCRSARTRGEIAVCQDSGLASLDRQMASQFNRAMSGASPGQRQMLVRTRGRFLSYRDRCRSDACIAEAYQGRMAEIRDIVSGGY